MIYNSASKYPQEIDPLVFFQDNGIKQAEIMTAYQDLITSRRYTDAIQYINAQPGINGYFAELFNLIENRIASLQAHLLTRQSLHLSCFAPVEPIAGTHRDMVWVEVS